MDIHKYVNYFKHIIYIYIHMHVYYVITPNAHLHAEHVVGDSLVSVLYIGHLVDKHKPCTIHWCGNQFD